MLVKEVLLPGNLFCGLGHCQENLMSVVGRREMRRRRIEALGRVKGWQVSRLNVCLLDPLLSKFSMLLELS